MRRHWLAAAALALAACGEREARPLGGPVGIVDDAAGPGAESALLADKPADPAAATAPAPSGSVADWAGLYAFEHDNGLVSGETFRSTDTLVVDPLDEATAVIAANLEFFNGHICSLAGVARLEGGELVYRSPGGPDSEAIYAGCVLRFSRVEGELRFADEGGACRQTSCGARGGYTDYAMPLASRRPLTPDETAAFRASAEYAGALVEAGR
jgi:hypothetical protein